MKIVDKLDLILVLHQEVADCPCFRLREWMLPLEVTGAWMALRAARSGPGNTVVAVEVDTVLILALTRILIFWIHVLSFFEEFSGYFVMAFNFRHAIDVDYWYEIVFVLNQEVHRFPLLVH